MMNFKLFIMADKAKHFPLNRSNRSGVTSLVHFSDNSLFGVCYEKGENLWGVIGKVDQTLCRQKLFVVSSLIHFIHNALLEGLTVQELIFDTSLSSEKIAEMNGVFESLSFEKIHSFIWELVQKNQLQGLVLKRNDLITFHSAGLVEMEDESDFEFVERIISSMPL